MCGIDVATINGREVLPLLWGWNVVPSFYPRLAPWARVYRPYGAELRDCFVYPRLAPWAEICRRYAAMRLWHLV
jgi:hypothetical protein